MFSVFGDELIEPGVYSGKEIGPGSREHLRDRFKVGPARSAELLLVQVISSALRAVHISPQQVGPSYADSTPDAALNQIESKDGCAAGRPGCKSRGDDRDHNLSLSGTIALYQQDALPRAEPKLPALDWNRQARSHYRADHVIRCV